MRDHPGPFWCCCLFVLLASPGAFSQQSPSMAPQSFDVSAFAGYQLNGDATLSGGELEIGDSATFGAAFDLRVHRAASLELSWEYTKPTERFRAFSSQFVSSRPFGVGTHYFQAGAMHVRRVGPRLEPFFGLTIGAALHLPDTIQLANGTNLESGATWRFALTAMLGTKIWLTPNLGLRLEGRVFGPVVFSASDFYAGTAGTGFTALSSIPYLQFAFTAGLAVGKWAPLLQTLTSAPPTADFTALSMLTTNSTRIPLHADVSLGAAGPASFSGNPNLCPCQVASFAGGLSAAGWAGSLVNSNNGAAVTCTSCPVPATCP